MANKTQSNFKNHGFTLIEVIVILAVISILVAILTPTVLKYIAEAQDNRAREDVKIINAMLNDLIKDTGKFPGSKLGSGKLFLVSPGTLVTSGTTWATSANDELLSNHLIVNSPGGTAYPTSGKRRYKGPYLQGLDEDPWGNAYEINAEFLVGGNTSVTWVISAGPDGIFQTATTDTVLSGDDVGIRIK